MTTSVSNAQSDLAPAAVATRTQRGITVLSLADMAHVAGGGFILGESATAKPPGFILGEKPRIAPLGFILSE